MTKNIGVNNQLAIEDARDDGIIPRQFFWIGAKHRTTLAIVNFGLWTGDDPITLNVISGTTGLPVSRTYQGGVNLDIGDIPLVSDMTIQNVDVSFSANAPICNEIVRIYDVRLAKVEVHEGWLSPATRVVADEPEIAFLGQVDAAPNDEGAVQQDNLWKLKIISDAIAMLARPNPRKRSYEGQKRRSGDEFGLFGGSVKTWRVFWGEHEPNADLGRTDG